MTVQNIPRLLTIRDAAERAQVSIWTVRKEIEDGNLVPRRIRGCLRILDTELDRWMEEAS